MLHSQSASACARRSARKAAGVNIGDVERAGSIVVGGGLSIWGLRHLDSLSGIALTLLGGSLVYRGVSGHCSMYQQLGVNTGRSPATGVPARHGSRVEKAILINARPEELYRFWRRLENLPRFLNHLESVRDLGNNRSHWVAVGPLGIRGEWDAEIINEVPGQLIAWRSLPGSQVDTAGSVRFTAGTPGRGTEVRVELKYDPPGGRAGVVLAHLLGEAPDQQLAADLFRLKRVVEAGELPALGGQPSGRRQGAQAACAATATSRDDAVEEASAESFPASDPPGWTASSATSNPGGF